MYLGVQKPNYCVLDHTQRVHSGFRTFSPTSNDTQEENRYLIFAVLCFTCTYHPKLLLQ